MIKVNPEKYIQLFAFNPSLDMVLSGWLVEYRSFLGIPYIIYTKPMSRE